MIEAHNLAGFISAHGIWCVSNGEILTPMYAYATEQGERVINRLVTGSAEESVAIGREKLAENKEDATDAVFIFDGRIPIGNKKFDALIVEIKSHFTPTSKVTIAVPYSPTENGDKFKVYKPKILQWESCDDFDLQQCVNAFFDGVDSHDKGAEVWNEHLDQSI